MWRLEEWRTSNLSDDVKTLASSGSGLPLVSLTSQGPSSSALPTSGNGTGLSSSRFAHLWAPENVVDNGVSSTSSPVTLTNKGLNENTWTPPTSLAFSPDQHFRTEFNEGINGSVDSSYGLLMNGIDLPPLCSTPFPFGMENEIRPTKVLSASPSSNSYATTLSDISALLNESCIIDSGFSSDNNSNIWNSSPVPQGCQPSPTTPYLTPKQAIHCLQIIQDFQDSTANYSHVGLDPGQRAHAATLTNILQHHFLSVLLSPSPTSPAVPSIGNNNSSLERSARFHRETAAAQDAKCTWSGQLPPRNHRNPVYSCKVFLGGVPWDITEFSLLHAFKPFGNAKVEWPGKDGSPSQPKGYAYIVFENEKQVKTLLQNCTHDYSKGGNYYFKMSSKKLRAKEVQVIPWALGDSDFVRCQASKLDPQKTIFVGALHGMLNAEGLAKIMQDLFGGVVHAGIDTDRHKYPIGSGRVSFNNNNSYIKAVSAAFVEIRTSFYKKVQLDPYLEDATCSKCRLQQGPYFCRDFSCYRYFCRTCFEYHHSDEAVRSHRPLMRNSNKSQVRQNSAWSTPAPYTSNSVEQVNGFGFSPTGRSYYDTSTPFVNGNRGPSRFSR